MSALPLDYQTLRVIWWLLLGVLLIGFACQDGHGDARRLDDQLRALSLDDRANQVSAPRMPLDQLVKNPAS